MRTDQEAVKIYSKLIEKGVPGSRIAQLARLGLDPRAINDLHDGNGNLADPATSEDTE